MLRYITPFLLLMSWGCSDKVDVIVCPSSRFSSFGYVDNLQVSRDGARLLTVFGRITLWDTSSQKVSWYRLFSDGGPTHVSLSEDGKRIFAVWNYPVEDRWQCKVRILDAAEGDVLESYCLDVGGRIKAIDPGARLGYVVYEDSGGFIDLKTGRKVAEGLRFPKIPYCKFSPDGKVAALWGRDDKILVVRLAEEQMSSIKVAGGVVAVVDDTVFVRDADWYLWSYSATGKPNGRRRVVQGEVRAFALVPASRQYVCFKDDGLFCVGSLDGESTKACAAVLGPYGWYGWDIAASANGLLAISGVPNTTYPIPTPYLGCVRYSPIDTAEQSQKSCR